MGVFFEGDNPRSEWADDAIGGKAQSSDQKWLATTVTVPETIQGRYRTRNGDYALVARAQQLALIYATMNATAASSAKRMLVMPAGAKAAKSFHRRPIAGKALNRYLRNPRKGYGPGAKAAQYAENAGDLVEVLDHPALQLMRNPNPWYRGNTWAFHCYMQWMLTGRRYTHVVVQAGKPSELWPMMCQYARIVPSREGFIDGYVYGRDGTIDAFFEAEEVLYHRFRPSPFSPFDALGPMHAITQEADIYSAATVAELASWENQGRPDWVFPVSPETTEDQMKQLRAELVKMYGGPRNRGKVLLATLDSTPTPLQFKPKEMEYVLGKQDLRSVMRLGYGIPDALDEGNEHNLTSAGAAEDQYQRRTILPLCNTDAEEWSETLLPMYGHEPGDAWFVDVDVVKEDLESIREDAKVYVPMGVWSVNEVRVAIGDEPIPGGDEYRNPAQEAKDALEAKAAQAKPDGPPNKGKAIEPHACACGGHKHEPEEKPTACQCHKNHGGKKQPDAAEILATLPQVVGGPNLSIVEELEAIVLRWLETIAANVTIPASGEFPADALNKFAPQLAESIAKPMQGLVGGGISDGSVEIGQRPEKISAFSSDIGDAVRANNLRLAGSVTDTQTERIKEIIAKGLEDGIPQGEMASKVREVLEGERPARAAIIARHESARAYNYGKAVAWEKHGYWGTRVRLAPGACPICIALVDAYGHTKPFGTPYVEKGESLTVPGKDKPVKFDYETVYYPPFHVLCRCGIEPVKEKPDGWEDK